MPPPPDPSAPVRHAHDLPTLDADRLEELRDLCLEADVKFIACQMTVDLFEFDKSEFIDNVEYGGAATFFGFAGETDICLFI